MIHHWKAFFEIYTFILLSERYSQTGPSWFLQSQASCHGHQRPQKSSRCNMYTSLEYVFLDLLVKFGQLNFAYSPPSQIRFSSIQNNRNQMYDFGGFVKIWRFRENLARSTLRTLHRHRPGSLPFKPTGMHLYDFVEVRKNLARSTLCTLHRHRPGSLPFKTTGIHIYEFGGCVKIWPGQLCVLSPVTDPVLFHSKQPEYIFMNLEVLYTAKQKYLMGPTPLKAS